MTLNTVTGGNRIRWDGHRKPFYEIYYLKLNDPLKTWSFWARYALVSPVQKGIPPQASLWGIFYSVNKGYVALKKTFSLLELDIFHRDYFIQLDKSYLTLSQSIGTLEDSAHQIEWELNFEDPNQMLQLFPYSSFYRLPFPKTKFLEPRLSTMVSGSIQVDGERLSVLRCRAHQAHLWGTAYANRWVWGNCNTFLEDPTAVFEGLIAEISVGSFSMPPLPLFYFVWRGQSYKANGVRSWFTNKSKHQLLEWCFEVQCNRVKFVGKLSRSIEQTIGVGYVGPNGEKRYCHNTMMADMELMIYQKEGRNWFLTQKLSSPKSAAFETVEPQSDPRVKFLL